MKAMIEENHYAMRWPHSIVGGTRKSFDAGERVVAGQTRGWSGQARP
jgi:hypothetical protein